MTTPDAGWYTDPGHRVRWWDGTRWTEHLRPHPSAAAAPAQPPVPVIPVPPAPPTFERDPMAAQPGFAAQPGYGTPPVAPRRADRERQMRRNNPYAYTGILLVLIAALINLYSIPSLLGAVFSIVGLVRAGTLDPSVRYNGRVTSIIGLVLGLLLFATFWWHFLLINRF